MTGSIGIENGTLVGCSRVVVVSTHRKLCMDSQVANLYPVVYCPLRTNARVKRRLLQIISRERKASIVEHAESRNHQQLKQWLN